MSDQELQSENEQLKAENAKMRRGVEQLKVELAAALQHERVNREVYEVEVAELEAQLDALPLLVEIAAREQKKLCQSVTELGCSTPRGATTFAAWDAPAPDTDEVLLRWFEKIKPL